MKTPVLITVCSAFVCAMTASATPVTGWSVGLGSPTLSNGETSSPTFGDNTADNADNSALHAAFPSITLGVGERLTFSGSMQLSTGAGAAPSALANEIRIGIFDHNGSSGLTGWLGYYASNPSGATGAGVRERVSGAYYSQNTTILFGTNNLADTSKSFADATYDFALSLERTDAGIAVSLTMENGLGYSTIPASFEDTTPSTFTFDRVGFLSGGNLNADQIQFNNLDVSVTPVPEPATWAMFLSGGLVLARCGFKVRKSRRHLS